MMGVGGKRTSFSSFAYHNHKGKIIFVVGIGQDIAGCMAQKWENKTQGGGGGTQHRGRGRDGMAMGNLVLSIVGSGSGGRGYVCHELPQKEDGEAGMMGKGGGVADNETQGGG
jgi:hypothetical protein